MEGSASIDVTTQTWRKICAPGSGVGGLGLWPDENAPMVGICHFIIHPTTGNLNPVCYMQDLYVDPAARKQGYARTLVTTLAEIGTAEKWARIYWLAENGNDPAQQLYKSLGVKLDFSLHVLPLR